MSKSISTYFKKLSLSKLPKVHWKLYSILYFKHFQLKLNSSFLIITLLSFIRKILTPFDYNTNKKFTTNVFLSVGKKNPTNVFQTVGKKMSYQCFQAGSAIGDDARKSMRDRHRPLI